MFPVSAIFDVAISALTIVGAATHISAENDAASYLAPVDPAIINVATKAHVSVSDGSSYEAWTVMGVGEGSIGGDVSFYRQYPDGREIALCIVGGDVFMRTEENVPGDLPPEFADFIEGHQFHRATLAPGERMVDAGAPGERIEWQGMDVVPLHGETRFGVPLTFYFSAGNKQMLGMALTIIDADAGDYRITFLMKDWETRNGIPIFNTMVIDDRDTIFTYNFHEIIITREGETPPGFIC